MVTHHFVTKEEGVSVVRKACMLIPVRDYNFSWKAEYQLGWQRMGWECRKTQPWEAGAWGWWGALCACTWNLHNLVMKTEKEQIINNAGIIYACFWQSFFGCVRRLEKPLVSEKSLSSLFERGLWTRAPVMSSDLLSLRPSTELCLPRGKLLTNLGHNLLFSDSSKLAEEELTGSLSLTQFSRGFLQGWSSECSHQMFSLMTSVKKSMCMLMKFANSEKH